jgi:hypothetical protein
LPFAEAKIEPTKEVITLYRKMKTGQYYSEFELYRKMFGSRFQDDVVAFKKKGTPWVASIRLARLRTLLDVLVTLEKLRTGTKKGELPKEDIEGQIYDVELPVYYSLVEKAPRKRRV